MRIIVDGFGGDNAPLEVLKGAVLAVKNLGVEVTVVGDTERINTCAKENNIDISQLKIHHAETVMDVCCDPALILKEYSNSSMAVGLKLLKDGEGDAFVSAGSTGALVMGATFIVKRLKGIKRAALATVVPTVDKPVMLLDVGANAECRPEMLLQFGIMGSAYMNLLMGVDNPRVALANIGAERTKGRELEIEAYNLLEKAPINFIGNIEAREVPLGGSDVVVSDGFTGNILLKTYEGMGKFMGISMKQMLSKNIGVLFLLNRVNAFKRKMDYKEYGGAPLLGTSKPVIKAHGSSDEKAFYNAIRQAKIFHETNVIGEFSEALAALKAQTTTEE
ncbi:MAG: phosphate acyltransferase PlsX [Oscillospiraceae bacterium]|nr:phosphate acyltransferase PlsX [Oscillospiraceae bacterium]